MHTYDKYWLTNLGRGLLALLASIGAGFLPSLVDSTISRLLFMPLAMAISIVCLSLYGILDCSLLVITGYILPKGRKVHWLVILQGFAGLISLVAATLLAGDGLNLRFFVFFAGLQALFTALAEGTIAVRAKHHLGTAWLLMCSAISLTCSVALLLGGNLSAFEQAAVDLLVSLALRSQSDDAFPADALSRGVSVASVRILECSNRWRESETTGNGLTVARKNSRSWLSR